MTTNNTIANIATAAEILDRWSDQPAVNTHAEPEYEQLGNLWGAILDERNDNHDRAEKYASEKTGYVFDMMSMFDAQGAAYTTLRDTEFARLEANARERRILAIAAAF